MNWFNKKNATDDIQAKHFQCATKAKLLLTEWLKQNNINMYMVSVTAFGGKYLAVNFIFKKEQEYLLYKNTDTFGKIKDKYLEILEGLNYFKDFSAKVEFDFDSDEYIKKNYGYFAKDHDGIKRED